MIGAREAALLTLNDVFYNGAYSNLAVKEMLKKCRGMNKTDKALFTNLVYGVISHHYTIEYVIKKYSSVKLKKLARYVRIILELGIYQLVFMDKIPESAAVNESVKLAKKYCKKGSERFVNGVLRAFAKDGCKIEYPENELENMSVMYSFSEKMTAEFVKQFGLEFSKELMAALNEAPKLTLRANQLKITPEILADKLQGLNIQAEVCDGLVYTSGFDIENNQFYKEGLFSIQDKGAFNAGIALAPLEGETIIDMCAAPGGKTTHIAELMNDKGRIIACDIHPHKTELINNAAKRLGIKSIETRVMDSCVHNPEFSNIFDRVICDVPCSGWGIIRRKPDIKFSSIDLAELYEIQYSILKNASDYVKKGGCIVYSTCTVNKHENEEIIDGFLKENKGFKKVYEKTFYPHIDGCDGFFICRLVSND